jgi:uncharacterized protein
VGQSTASAQRRGQEDALQEQATGAYEVRASSHPLPEHPVSPRQRAALLALGSVLVPSRYNVPVKLDDGRVAVYNTFSATLSVLPGRAWERFLSIGSRTSFDPGAIPAPLKSLQNSGFLVPEGTDEIELVRQYYQRARYDRLSGFSANVLLTMGCNLACQYCFQGRTQVETKPRMMAAETENAVAEYLMRSAAGTKSLTLAWFGGEPLLGLRQIERMTPKLTGFCDAEGIVYRAVIQSNGVLLNREAVDGLAEALVSQIQVTLDVPAELKNDKQGRDTQDRVLDNLAYAAGRIPVQIRINLSRDDEKEWDRLYDGLVSRGLHKTITGMVIAHVYEPEAGRRNGVGSAESHQTYVDVLRREHQRATALGLPMPPPVTSRCGTGCAATSIAAVTIDPEGLLYKCPDDAGQPGRAHGSVFSESVANPGNLLHWLSYDWFNHAECRECTMLPQCAGGCAHKRLFQPGQPDGSYCYWYLRGNLEERIRAAHENLGGRD